jgi:hypothetical protein
MNNKTFEVLNDYDNHIFLGTARPNDGEEPNCHSILVGIEDFSKWFSLNYRSGWGEAASVSAAYQLTRS